MKIKNKNKNKKNLSNLIFYVFMSGSIFVALVFVLSSVIKLTKELSTNLFILVIINIGVMFWLFYILVSYAIDSYKKIMMGIY